MFKKQAQLTDYINSLIGKPLQYGIVDCNIATLKVVDILFDTDYHDKIFQKYTDAKSGYAFAKKEIGYTNAVDFLKKYYQETDIPSDGGLTIKKIKAGRLNEYHIGIVYSGFVLALKYGVFQMVPLFDTEYDLLLGVK